MQCFHKIYWLNDTYPAKRNAPVLSTGAFCMYSSGYFSNVTLPCLVIVCPEAATASIA